MKIFLNEISYKHQKPKAWNLQPRSKDYDQVYISIGN